MELLTEELRAQLPARYATEKEPDPLVVCKFFYPRNQWTWYVLEFDGEDTFFGFVVGMENELGYFSLEELSSFRDKLGQGIERDLYWRPCPLSTILEKYAPELLEALRRRAA